MTSLGLILVTLGSICWSCWCGYPEIDLGEVDLVSNPNCRDLIQPFLNSCTNEYRYKVQKAMERENFDENSERVRRAACCGVWVAQRCMTRAARSIRACDIKDARAFEKLPIDADAIALVDRRCHGLQYASKHCSSSVPHFTGINFVVLLFLCSTLNVLVVKTFAIY